MHNTLRCMKRDWQLYLFLLVPVAYILIFAYYPMLGIQIAFKDYSVAGGIWGSEWVGLEHFIKFVDSYQFERVIVNTLRLSIYSVLCGFPFPILFALLINTIEGARYKKVAQTIVNLPHFISVVVLVSMVNQVRARACTASLAGRLWAIIRPICSLRPRISSTFISGPAYGKISAGIPLSTSRRSPM